MKKIVSSLLAAGLALSAAQGVFAAGMGVGTHMGHLYPVKENVDTAAEIGAEWIRDSISWAAVEQEKGTLAIQDHHMNAFKAVSGADINLLAGLSYGNELYDGGGKFVMPTQDNEEYYKAFLNYAEFQVKELKDYVDAWEVWNEPNWANFNTNGASGTDYAKLYLDCAALVRKYDPTAKLVCGVVMGYTGNNLQYGKDIFAHLKTQGDVNTLMDAFSIHKYTNDAEGEYVDALNAWEGVFDEYGYTGDVWMTENGASSYTDPEDTTMTLSEDEQATYIARYGVQWEKYLMESNRNGEIFWYDLRDDGESENDVEHNYGLVDYSYEPKPAYHAAKLYNTLTNDKEFVNYTENGTGYAAEYSDGVDKTYILYDTEGTQSVELSGDVAYVYDYVGNLTETIENPSGTKSIELTGTPVYVECVSDSLKFISVKYNDNKNVLELTGLAPDAESVTITLEQDATVVQTLSTKVSEDAGFKKTFSVNLDGDYILKISDGTNSATREISCKRNSADSLVGEVTDSVVAYDTETRKGIVSAKVAGGADGEVLSVAVVPTSADIEKLTISDFVYISDTTVSNGAISKGFVLSEGIKGEYKVLVGRNGLTTPNVSSAFMANVWNWAYVSSLKVGEENSNINVQVKASNHNNTAKGLTIMVAQYAQNALLNVTSAEKTVPANQVEAVLYTENVTKLSGADSVKVFAWDSFGTLVPLCEVK